MRPSVPRPRDPGTPDRAPAPATVAEPAEATAARLAQLVPAPVEARPVPGVRYLLTADATIRTSADGDARAVGDRLAELLRPATGYPLPVEPTATAPTGELALLLGPATSAGPDAGDGAGAADGPVPGGEGYRLDVGAGGVRLRARTAAGLFYGVQTLRQLLPAAIESRTVRPGPWALPGARVVDRPRFAYRGAMLDVARHFFPPATVRRFVDHLARYKINYLHLHLTDDQGWRIAIDSWPRLAGVGGATEVDGGPGGHYTKAEYADLVAYAAARHITVVPEIDLPGHTNAALTAYGELAPDGVAPPPYTGTDVGFSAVAVHRERTYEFVRDVLGEVAALTPGPYLHIGGDEAFTLPPAEYAVVMERVQRIAAATGKTVLGWHQIATVDHPGDRVVQYWGTSTSDANVTAAVRQGARVLLSPGNRSYLDMKYGESTPLGKDWAGLVEVRTAYDWDPGAYLEGVPASAVLGVEAPLWTETVDSLGDIEFMTFPRLPAIAELGWSPAAALGWDGFRRRLAAHGPRWTVAGIAFHRSRQVPWPDRPTPAPAQAGSADVPAGSPTRVVGPVVPDAAARGSGPDPDDLPAPLG
ncbi:beta-N-acetylhexosaminidase [Micromonospora sp. NPDC049559]|uniref:beta-N-acetylhexosaminidase n=1 Tax=Micromonospora sp. NPDC049559 TaxID=3155923 RepID=UPI00341E10C7